DSTTCTIKKCSRVFDTLDELKEHVKTHSIEKPFQCGTCQMSFQHQYTLLRHINLSYTKDNKNNDIRKFACSICCKRFIEKDLLKKHMDKHSIERRYKCDQCSSSFKHSRFLARHKFMHSKPTKEEYVKCLYCNKEYCRKDYCAQHIKICHPGLPTELTGDVIKCSICMQTFKNLVDVRKHSQTHKKLLECEFCLLKIRSEFGLETHINKLHTDVLPSEDEEGTFECPTCVKKFTTSRILESHLIIHKRPFMCAICSYSFSSKILLNKHVITHRKYKPYGCSLCHKKFDFISELKKHKSWAPGDKRSRLLSPPTKPLLGQSFTMSFVVYTLPQSHSGESVGTSSLCSAKSIQYCPFSTAQVEAQNPRRRILNQVTIYWYSVNPDLLPSLLQAEVHTRDKRIDDPGWPPRLQSAAWQIQELSVQQGICVFLTVCKLPYCSRLTS
uniref:C2H2-type domain-containing protein n=1 Tax=Phlebotomus papatasi TaxID=29031 RepID=A0A1B0D7K8_PHLPP